ncbi:MAG: FAD-binding protein [Deltaproteobacteria bacterium]|nr:FAD-binding protein [Deltaproteobacteria bacterium]
MNERRRSIDQRMESDVLVIGAGAAGIRATLAAADAGAEVILACKGPFLRYGSTFGKTSSSWGIQAAWDSGAPGDTVEDHYGESFEAGLGEANPALVEILASYAPERLRDLMKWGVRFRRESDGGFVRVRACFGNYARAFVLVSSDQYRKCMLEQIRRRPIRTLDDFQAVGLEVSEGMCVGARGLRASVSPWRIRAGSTVLACGGGASAFRMTMAHPSLVGSAYALAYDAGVEVVHMEFIQFVLGTVWPHRGSFFPLYRLDRLIPVRNKTRDNVWDKCGLTDDLLDEAIRLRPSHIPFSCRDVSGMIDVALALELLEGGGLDRGGLETSLEGYRCGIEHFAHAFNGGVRIDERAETSLPGLFAAGEAAGGIHGADRLGGNMMAATQVFGAIAGVEAARRAITLKGTLPSSPVRSGKIQARQGGKTRLEWFSFELDDCAAAIGVVREPREMARTLERIAELLDELETEFQLEKVDAETYYFLTQRARTIERVATFGLKRSASLGSHFRLDDPPKNWSAAWQGTAIESEAWAGSRDESPG